MGCVGTLENVSEFGGERIVGGAHNVEIVHFALLKVAVTATRVVEGVERMSPVVGEMSVVGLAEETPHFLVFFLKAGVLLFELTNLDEGGWECGYLVGGEAEGGLELCDGLLELGRGG